MSYKKLSQFQVQERASIPLVRMIFREEEGAENLVKLIPPFSIVDLLVGNLRSKNV